MTMKLLFAGIAVVAGGAAAFQSAANSGLSGRTGLGPALLINSVIVLVASIVLWLGEGRRTVFFPENVSWTLYLGGIFGFIIIAAMAYVFPKMGGAVAVALMVLGLGAAALVIDHFGLMGMPKDPVTLARIGGMILVAGGVVLLRV